MRNKIQFFIDSFLESLDSSRHFEEVLALRSFLRAAKKREGTVYFLGNGASASISSTLAFKALAEQGIRALALTDHNLLLGMARKRNFSEWMSGTAETLLGPEDALVLTSSSGASENVINMAKFARQKGIPVFSLTGFDSQNELKSIADAGIWVNSSNYNVVESAHLLLGLLAVRFVESADFDEDADFERCIEELRSLSWLELVEKLGLLSEVLGSMDFEKNRVIFIGDGSSASIASHLATDFSKSGLTAQAFNDHSFLSASQNDFGSTEWISVGIDRSYREGDLLIFVTHSNLFPAEKFALDHADAKRMQLSLHSTVQMINQEPRWANLVYPVSHPANELVAPSLGLLGIAEAFLENIGPLPE